MRGEERRGRKGRGEERRGVNLFQTELISFRLSNSEGVNVGHLSGRAVSLKPQ